MDIYGPQYEKVVHLPLASLVLGTIKDCGEKDCRALDADSVLRAEIVKQVFDNGEI